MLPRTKLETIRRLKAAKKPAVVSALIALAVLGLLEMLGLHEFRGLSILAFCLVFFLLFMVHVRSESYNRFVLWLRHFQERDPRQLRLGALMFMCSDLFIPITLRDRSFGRSIGSAYFRLGGRALFLVATVVMPLFPLTALLLFVVLAWLDLLSDKAILPMVVLAFVLALFPVTVYLSAKWKSLGLPGWYRLSVDSPTSQAASILDRTLQRDYPFADSVVIQCPDEAWREVVEFVVDRASVVLIDVSEPTDNLMWEMETVFARKSPAEVIVTCGTRDGAWHELPGSVHEKLERILGMDEFSRLRVFYYPAEQPPLGWKRIRLYYTLSRTLREELLDLGPALLA